MPQTNRRLTARHACQLQAFYRGARDWHPATVMDLSPHGCRLRLGEDLPRGGSVSVRFTHAAGEEGAVREASVQGTVIWARLEGLSYQAGIHFPGVSSELESIIVALR